MGVGGANISVNGAGAGVFFGAGFGKRENGVVDFIALGLVAIAMIGFGFGAAVFGAGDGEKKENGSGFGAGLGAKNEGTNGVTGAGDGFGAALGGGGRATGATFFGVKKVNAGFAFAGAGAGRFRRACCSSQVRAFSLAASAARSLIRACSAASFASFSARSFCSAIAFFSASATALARAAACFFSRSDFSFSMAFRRSASSLAFCSAALILCLRASSRSFSAWAWTAAISCRFASCALVISSCSFFNFSSRALISSGVMLAVSSSFSTFCEMLSATSATFSENTLKALAAALRIDSTGDSSSAAGSTDVVSREIFWGGDGAGDFFFCKASNSSLE